MEVIEFQALIERGMIEIPEPYRSQVSGSVRVLILTETVGSEGNFIEELISNPLDIPGFKPFSRDELYDRQ